MARTHREQRDLSPESKAYRRGLLDGMAFELIPMKSAADAIEALPANSLVSVTASPVHGMAPTRALTDELRKLAHRPIPHIAARLIKDRGETLDLAAWTRSEGYDRIFVVAGDAEAAHGPYEGGHSFLRDFLDAEHGVTTIGVPSYPDGHGFLSTEVCHEQLHLKQSLFEEAGVDGWTSTQMCFDKELITTWLEAERSSGLTMPVHLGLPGVVDRTRLMTTGVRLGVGASLRYLKKNRAALTKLISSSQYDPDEILLPIIDRIEPLGVTSLHVFTFNQVERTEAWRQAALTEIS